MNRKQGFTLVELLVVMAIIAILAAIAIPNIQSYIAKGKAVRAVGEIRNIEVALTKILSDAGRSSLNDLFLRDAVAVEVDARTGDGVGYLGNWTADQFDAAVDIYTEALYVLMKKGREAITEPEGTVLNADVIRNLGTAYFTDLGQDPWGNLYHICPGPWPRRIFGVESPNVFRKYLPQVGSGVPGDDSDNPDALTLSTVDFNFVDEDLTQIGFPAETRQEQFVWSFGANGISGQGRFLLVENGGSYFTGSNALQNYVGEQEPEFMGGGDDINSWDSSQSFMRFYN